MSVTLRICLTGIFLFLQIYLSAQEKAETYIKSPIPDSLTKGADAVCRLDEHDVEVISPGKIIVKERHIYTILNDQAEDLAEYSTHYDKLISINYVNGALFNSVGKEINRFKKKDMTDYAEDGEAFASDDRQKSSSFKYNGYPYTVAFDEEDAVNGAFYIPGWFPPRSNKISVCVSRYILTVPASYKFRYKMVNTDIKPIIVQKKDEITYTWEVRNLPVVPHEPFAISRLSYNPFMLVGPSEFEMEGYSGDMSEWETFGKFYYSLQKGRDILPDDVKQQVHVLTDHLNDPLKKIAVLYDYLQRNTHYVLISFGIGGYQPYDAAYVARNKYGDCKALSNYMISLLKEAGITGNAVIIKGDVYEPEFFPDFPSQQFNHVICAVPLEKDTVWLECTDQYLPAGYLGEFTANRYGLFVKEDGGKLVHTPLYSIADNTSVRKLVGNMDAEGNLLFKSETNYKALSHDPIEGIMHGFSKEQQLEYLKKSLQLPTYTVNSVSYKEDHTARIPLIQESLDISVANYGHLTGKRIFINPDVLQRSDIKFPEENERKLDFQFKKESSEIDSVEISIPNGYKLESEPRNISLLTKYGSFKVHSIVRDNKIFYYRQFDQYRGRFPAIDYENIKNFYNKIFDTDHAQMVLVKVN
jgi:hypothetical protein